MQIELFKIIFAAILWLCIVVFGLIPIKSKKFKENKLLLSLSNCFSGGLFMAIGLIHILPEAREDLEGNKKKFNDEGSTFALSNFICLATFSGILLLDKVIFNNSDIHEKAEKEITKDVKKRMFCSNIEKVNYGTEDHF